MDVTQQFYIYLTKKTQSQKNKKRTTKQNTTQTTELNQTQSSKSRSTGGCLLWNAIRFDGLGWIYPQPLPSNHQFDMRDEEELR